MNVDGHTLTTTRFCRMQDCPREVRAGAPTRGPWANLCDEHHTIEVAKRRGTSKPKTNGSGPAAAESFERKARGLVEVGRRLDRAVSKYRPAKLEMEEAMEAWRTVCRALAGDDPVQ